MAVKVLGLTSPILRSLELAIAIPIGPNNVAIGLVLRPADRYPRPIPLKQRNQAFSVELPIGSVRR
jgi:hypothetical protein